ncbi:hypothetical protein [Streptococcus danieliae]|uniref:hypothetical protein n=1 Tax=Streptococcus danieliae TaxID=747656 RepID=UPI0021C5ED53|nr:hypothetical protein [Streptococcus danieliae]MCU0083027.1 hypothetical protein [Streptococcus danieliae]
MKKYGLCLLAVLVLTACTPAKEADVKPTASSSSSQKLVGSSQSGSSTQKKQEQKARSSSSVKPAVAEEGVENQSAVSKVGVSVGASAGAMSQGTGVGVSQETGIVADVSTDGDAISSTVGAPAQTTGINGASLVAGDFSSIAGIWQDEFGNQLYVQADGTVGVVMAESDHIPEEERVQLTRDLMIASDFGTWNGENYLSRLVNEGHTSGLPYFSVDSKSGTVHLPANYAETYTGTFTRVE